MTTPPSVPQPPATPTIGLEDIDDPRTPEMPDEERNWADESQMSVADPDYLESLEPSTENPFDSLPPATEAEDEPKPKRKFSTASTAVFIDWSKATPRKEDDFAPSRPTNVPSTSQKVRDFLNAARDNGWYGLYYPVIEYPNRNSAQAQVTKVNGWRKGKTNVFGVRDGENIAAKCERQQDKFIVWVGLLLAEGQTVPEGMNEIEIAEAE